MRIWDINPTDRTVIDPTGREAPLDPMRREPLIPAGATSIAPPGVAANEAVRWTGEAWEVVADYRGHVYWLSDGSRHEITELGAEPPNDAIDAPKPSEFHDWDGNKWVEDENKKTTAWRETATVTRRQAKQALLLSRLLANVQPAIDAIEDDVERGMVQIFWDDATHFERNNAQLIALGEALGLTDEQMDDLFKQASEL